MIQAELCDDGVFELQLKSDSNYYMSMDDIKLFRHIIKQSEINPDIHGLLVSGNGKCFCAGLLITEIVDKVAIIEEFDRLLIDLFSFSKPMVAYVNGHSIGGGILLQATADAVFLTSNEKAKFSLPEFSIGMTIDTLMHHVLKRYLGENTLHHWLFSDKHYKSSDLINCLGTQMESTSNGIDEVRQHLLKLIQFGRRFNVYKASSRIEVKKIIEKEMTQNCFQVFSNP